MEQADLAVVGGGASGMTAAAEAARVAAAAGGRMKIVLLEKNQRIGKKLMLTGNGRCNLLNRDAGLSHYHGDMLAGPVLEAYPPERIAERFRQMGLLCRELDEGRMYPYSLQASSVLNILRRELEASGVETVCGAGVESVRRSRGGFLLSWPEGELFAGRVILAPGGKACPQSGSDGDGFALAKAFGHSATPLFPSLVQVRTDAARVRPLKGVRCPVKAAFRADGDTLRSVQGEVQFTDNALSGICIFELSRCLGELRPGRKAEISLDLCPEYSVGQVGAFLRETARTAAGLPAAQMTEGFLPKALGTELAKFALGTAAKSAGELSEAQIEKLAETVKNFAFPVTGTLSWDRAQVTAGGVPLSELTETLESRKCPGLYLCGELLDVDGDCGGFNLRWAWASGLTAGRAAARP